jgi:hypothetical protein
MTDELTTPTSMYCRQCGYQLAGLSENRCPECGRAFDPGNRRTFLCEPRSWSVRRWARRIAVALAAAVLLGGMGYGGLWGYVYWKYHADWVAEQKAIAALKRVGVEFPLGPATFSPQAVLFGKPGNLSLVLPPAVPRSSGRLTSAWLRLRWWASRFTFLPNYLRDRVQYIQIVRGQLTDDEFANVAAFKHAKQILLIFTPVTDQQLASLADMKDLTELVTVGEDFYPEITDAGLEHLKGLTRLRRLSLSGRRITGKGLKFLQTLVALQKLELRDTQISDDDLALLRAFPSLASLNLTGALIAGPGLVHLNALPAMRILNLSHTMTSDAGLVHLGQMGSLAELRLADTKVTDKGLAMLTGLKNLHLLDVNGTLVTRKGVELLHKALPGAETLWSLPRMPDFSFPPDPGAKPPQEMPASAPSEARPALPVRS